MSEEKKNWFKELLEWLHHAYWIGELLFSVGIADGIGRVMSNYFHLDLEWRLIIAAAIGGIFFIASHWFVSKWLAHDRPSDKGQWLELATSATSSNSEAFDVARFMKTAYVSSMQPEFEASVNRWRATIATKEREAFFVRFIASGLIAFLHDTTWWSIFKSQLLALDSLNNSILRVEQVKEFYDAAAKEYPGDYADYSFDEWLGYLKSRVLIIELPGETIGITERGKDFLKHIVHWGNSRTGKRR